MPLTDDRSTGAAPSATPPSFVRRHPILAGFGVLSGLSLFTALWPVSAIVITVAIAAHATGVDRVAWSLTRRVAARLELAVRGHGSGAAREHPAPAPPMPPPPATPAPSAPLPPGAPAPSAPRHRAHQPRAAARLPREPRGHAVASRRPVKTGHERAAEHPVETGVDGPGL